jgi:hypothetical protein
MKVLLYDDLFYYTIAMMHTDIQELMRATECIHSVLSTIIRDDMAGIDSTSCELCT